MSITTDPLVIGIRLDVGTVLDAIYGPSQDSRWHSPVSSQDMDEFHIERSEPRDESPWTDEKTKELFDKIMEDAERIELPKEITD